MKTKEEITKKIDSIKGKSSSRSYSSDATPGLFRDYYNYYMKKLKIEWHPFKAEEIFVDNWENPSVVMENKVNKISGTRDYCITFFDKWGMIQMVYLSGLDHLGYSVVFYNTSEQDGLQDNVRFMQSAGVV